MTDVNTGLDNFKSVLHSYNLVTNEWTIPITNGIAPERRKDINGVINNETGKIYIFGGIDDFPGIQDRKILNDMNIFDTATLTWSKGSIIDAPIPRVDYTATLLSNGIIVFIGGREGTSTTNFLDVDINRVNKLNTLFTKKIFKRLINSQIFKI